MCGRREALRPGFCHQLILLDHVPALNADQRALDRLKRLAFPPETRHPLDPSMLLFDHVLQLFHLTEAAVGAVCLVVALDGGGIGLTAVKGARPSAS